MEIIAIDEANGIVTVEVAPKAYVDVKGERYVMQNEDGSTVYLGTGLPCGNVEEYGLSEQTIIDYVRKKNLEKAMPDINSGDAKLAEDDLLKVN